MTKTWFLIGATILSACGQGSYRPEPNFWVEGVGIKVEPSAARWTQEADFIPRLSRLLEVSLEYGGGSWDDLQGFVIVFASGEITELCEDHAGCTHVDQGWLAVATGDDRCIEESVLPHEVLHVLLPSDRCHISPLWRDFQGVADLVNPQNPTYTDIEGVEQPCPVVPSQLTMESDC